MKTILKSIVLLSFLLLSCKKDVGISPPKDETTPSGNVNISPSDNVSTPLSPHDKIYRLIAIGSPMYSANWGHDSLIIFGLNSPSVLVNMRLARNIQRFTDSCGVYSGNTSALQPGNPGIEGISFPNYGFGYSSPIPLPTHNHVANFRFNGDTLRVNLSYTCIFWNQGKENQDEFIDDLIFLKAN